MSGQEPTKGNGFDSESGIAPQEKQEFLKAGYELRSKFWAGISLSREEQEMLFRYVRYQERRKMADKFKVAAGFFWFVGLGVVFWFGDTIDSSGLDLSDWVVSIPLGCAFLGWVLKKKSDEYKDQLPEDGLE